ncbi:MAG: ABC transporter permease [Lewinellaceae bacterium]|nr:ABC transporter permease [Lewinellaceae bacterium]
MKNLISALWAEWMKVRRSRVAWLVFAAFSLLPFIGGFFMILLKNPEAASNVGIVSQKAKLLSGQADWPSYFGLLSQGVALGGMIVFGFLSSWIFGREHADRTLKDLLALPVPRTSIVLAKYVTLSWLCVFQTIAIFLEALLVGYVIGLPGWTQSGFLASAQVFFIAAGLTILMCFPVAFFAHWGKGYLSALGFVIFSMVLAQVVAAAGYGAWFPWTIPGLYSGMAGPGHQFLTFTNLSIVVLTSLTGVLATLGRWKWAEP